MAESSRPPSDPPVTRLAPSPTGALHLGNARTFLVNWALARRRGWRIILRVDDLAGPRAKPHAVDEAIRDLRWLGLDWDDGPVFQSVDLAPYRKAMRKLASRGSAYPSDLTRKQILEALSAPHGGEDQSSGGEVRFPPEWRPPLQPLDFDEQAHRSWRFVTPDEAVIFNDEFAGEQRQHPHASVGDFPVWTKEGEPAYQLATVVDDHRMGVTHIVRGDDLLDSAARQILLFRALGYSPEPAFIHLPLVVGPDGRRLAKRHGDTRIAHYRDLGVSPERIVGLLASWSRGQWRGRSVAQASRPCAGKTPAPLTPIPMSAREFAETFRLDTMPSDRTVFTPEHDRWLRAESSSR